MTLLMDEGDGIAGKRIVFIARKLDGPHLVRKSASHRGLQGKLYDAEVYIDVAIEKTR
jgi:hypothetical protein